ncbi:RNA polymerase factor sigma-54 [Burkholderiaceae bacterium DAT-1]|nr:RNA polymerase factor sigma-54 [Burkholderiaceae bacterium DAT-1]
MKQSLQLKLSQQLSLTPQLQQAIRLLQLSTLDLNQEIEQFLTDNPMLERGDEPAGDNDAADETPLSGEDTTERDFDADTDENWWQESSGSSRNDDDQDFDPRTNISRLPTLREHLMAQLGELPISDRDHALAEMIVDALDEDGYLTTPLQEILELLPADFREEQEIEIDDLSYGWKLVRQLDPCGVGAVDLEDCIRQQLTALESDQTGRKLALEITKGHLDLLAAKEYSKLKKTLKCDDQQLKEAQELIRRMNPRPGAAFGESETRYVIADVVVKKTRQGWLAQLNGAAVPKLRINQLYANILRQNKEGGSSLAGQLQEARWLIKNVQQRFDTILRVAQAIVEKQQRFLEHGEVAMRPLVLRDIADELGLHESTVSRVTTQKFMLTPRGVFEFKYFFGSHVDTDSGGECSATAIKALIKQLVQNEDKNKPLSDSALTDSLCAQGIKVARRTVAKYREALNIPPVNLRKSL